MTEATFDRCHGHVNGYDGSLGLDGEVGHAAKPITTAPIFEQLVVPPTSAVAEATVPTPTVSTPAEAGPARHTTVAHPAGATNNSTAAEKSKSRHSKVKYVPQAQLDAEQARLEELSHAALAGDTTALDKLRSALDNCPHIWRRLADLQYLIEIKLIALVAGQDPLRSEAFRKRCSELRPELLDGKPSSLAAKMAASRVVACWQFVQLLELRVLESPTELHNFKALEQAERRYQTAMRTFCHVRQADLQLALAQQNLVRGA